MIVYGAMITIKFKAFAEYLKKKHDEGLLDVLTNRKAFLVGSSC